MNRPDWPWSYRTHQTWKINGGCLLRECLTYSRTSECIDADIVRNKSLLNYPVPLITHGACVLKAIGSNNSIDCLTAAETVTRKV